MEILITGGAGFIGSFTADRLIELGHKVKIFDNLDPQVHPNGRVPAYLNRAARFIKGDVRDYNLLKDSMKDVDIIFHFAACVGVGQSQYEIKKYVDVTIGGTANLLDILVNCKNKIKKIIFSASMSSYGEGLYSCESCGQVRPGLRPITQLKQRQWEPLCPNCKSNITPIPIDEQQYQYANSIYAITKKVQEEMIFNISRTYDIPAVGLRYFNVYGPRQALSNPYTGVCAIFISRVKNGEPPVIYEDGLQTRDFISIYDVVDVNLLAMSRGEAEFEVFNVGTGRATSIKQVANTLIELSGKDLEPLIIQKFRFGDIRHCFADISKLTSKLGFKPRIDFRNGMRELMDWAKNESAYDGFEQAQAELKEKGLVG